MSDAPPPPLPPKATDPKAIDNVLHAGHNIGPEWGGVIGWFAHNHVAANILMLLFIVGGMLAISGMQTETFPPIDPKTISIHVAYPGATPYEIADSITNRIENELTGINGVKRIVAIASEGSGAVYVSLKDFIDQNEVYNDVETAVNGLVDFPPADAERPIITKIDVVQDVMRIAVYGQATPESLKYWAKLIEDGLTQRPEISMTHISGVLDNQISVEVSEQTLQHYDLSLSDISTAIRAFSIDIPAGTIESTSGDILLRIQERRYRAEDFQTIAVKTLPTGATLYLGDIANIIDGFEDQNLISRFNNKPAAFITIQRSSSEDALEIASAAKTYLSSLSLPHGLTIALQEDRTNTLKERISLMLRNAVLGFALVFVILLLFLDLKLAFWTSIAIPVSFLGGLMIVSFMGYSINMVSLFALIVVLGIVVDDAIIVGESIFEAQEKYHDNPHAVMHGVKRVISPVAVGVTTTIAAFAPLIFSTGTLGQIIKVIPIMVIPILIVSLLEAFFILPAHLSSPKRWSQGIVSDIRRTVTAGLTRLIQRGILPFAQLTIRWRYVTLAAFFAWGIVTAGMLSSGTVRFVFFPRIESDRVDIALKMPVGTAFSDTQAVMEHINTAALKTRATLSETYGKDIVDNLSLTIGESSSSSNPGANGSNLLGNHLGKLRIRLISSEARDISSAEVEAMIRKRIGTLPTIEQLSFESSAMGEDADIEVELTHPDNAQLTQAADALKNRLTQIEGTKEVADDFEAGKAEYVFSLTPEGLAAGVTPALLGQQLRHAYFGLETERLQRGGEDVLVYVRYPKAERESLSSLANARIRLPSGDTVPLAAVATVSEQTGYSRITSVNGMRTVSVTADVDYAITTPNTVMAAMTDHILPELTTRFPGLNYSFEGQSREQNEDLASLGRNAIIALMLIYILLGAQLRSYVQPIVIMSAIPFGVFGAIWGHFLLGYDFNFISLFGIVALSGIVVNDSVVLMDYFNMQKRAGLSTYDAILQAIERRFRPILLTTLTTSLGLLPILMETSMQARFLIPMVISLAVGIIFATAIILLLIPNLLVIIEDIKSLSRRGRIIVSRRASRLTRQLIRRL